ncbi:regucalcin-like [Danaus plexippus]|uniref:regucalcin-like n=1 Tax=Danaus plexippus TaxID=13037 RepID=UPI002AB24542|nr:regucalcin-like [Danaus plexippus]
MASIKCFLIVALLSFCVESKVSTPLIKNIHQGGVLSESPLWVNEEGALYWADILSQKIFRLEIDTGNVTSKYIGYGPVSLIIRVKDYPKLLLISVRSELYFLNWDNFEGDKSLRLLTAVDLGHPDNRCNDGKVDAKGRLWFGTIGKESGSWHEKDAASVYMLTENNFRNPEIKIRPVSISNGIAWSSDNKYMMYIDSSARAISVYDFDLETGKIENGRTLFSFPANNLTGSPDGMTIDRDDNLWVACFNDGKVIKVDPRAGKLLEQHRLPATKITSVMWGGYDYSTLYVTSASKDLTGSELAQQPEAGSVFAITGTGSSGYPMNEFIFKDADKY